MANEQCPNPDRCGSCSWSHIPYEKQLKQKLSDINGSFALKDLTIECTEILPSPRTSHYRNRMDFVINFQGEVGLREKGKWWRVIDNHTCFISEIKIEELFYIIRTWVKESGLSFFDRKTHTGFLRYAVIRSTSLGESMVTIVTSAPLDEEKNLAQSKLEELAKLTSATTLIWAINHTTNDVSAGDELKTISGLGTIKEKVGDKVFIIEPNSFFQTNSHAAVLLQESAREFLKLAPPAQHLLDLYCGSGFFGISVADLAQKVSGIEIVPEMIEAARLNAELNNVSINFEAAQAEKSEWKNLGADVIILDPPRSGLHDNVIKDLIEVRPATILYISCNYKSFAREFVMLGEHYEVTKMRAIDMFPHTPHVELISLLRARQS